MKEEKPKCFTEDEIKQLLELTKDAVRHSLREEDLKDETGLGKNDKNNSNGR